MHPGQYPGRPQEPARRLDEYRENPCERCGSLRRLPLQWEEHFHHYLKPAEILTKTKTAWLCLGCGIQVNRAGGAVTETDEGWLPADQIAILKRSK